MITAREGDGGRMRVIVWGLASGRGATKEAARGAFTWREYASRESIPDGDWLQILAIEEAST
jgi:hypothetical protein